MRQHPKHSYNCTVVWDPTVPGGCHCRQLNGFPGIVAARSTAPAPPVSDNALIRGHEQRISTPSGADALRSPPPAPPRARRRNTNRVVPCPAVKPSDTNVHCHHVPLP
ncbi:hypothetical protein [Acaryochloris marina]|uniref:hypothetical protein n=1 Tax=Acaryochloris marina TaxID=155978 RepID=UPI0021C46112|nr:hypothetical protein [Acaryochloris marina]